MSAAKLKPVNSMNATSKKGRYWKKIREENTFGTKHILFIYKE